MHRQVTAVANRLSLRPPQRRSLEILDRVVELSPPSKSTDRAAALATIQREFPGVTDFERDFPSLCFALATGVGKTRLMGAFISYLRLAHGIQNFFVMAPNLTIYNKLIADFTPGTPKYVFRGVAEFATDAPLLITGENYDQTLLEQLTSCRVNIFNISKINSEVRGGRSPRIKRLSEYIGESYFAYLANLPDHVLNMDESHRYRASAGVKAINELNPILGLELTATPFTESARGKADFKNIIYSYRLAQAMADGFVKEPAVVTRRNFRAAGMSGDEIEKLKLEDGVHLHEGLKVELDTYHRESGAPLIKPFLLVIARDTTHAGELQKLIASDQFFEGRYKDKVLQVDSSRTGAEEDAMVQSLLRVERADEPIEIVIHVNMLKEGWDVTNLYTIVPLRAAHARTLVEQSIGRGLRLPFGQRTGIAALDRLSIVAHDRFEEIVADCNAADSPLKIVTVEMDDADLARPMITVDSPSLMIERLGLQSTGITPGLPVVAAAFTDPRAQAVARTTLKAIQTLASDIVRLPGSAALNEPAVQARVLEEVNRTLAGQLTLEGTTAVDVAAIVLATCGEFARHVIDIPRVSVTPIGTVETGFNHFALDTTAFGYEALSEELFLRELRTGNIDVVALSVAGIVESRPENYIVAGLIDFDDVSYDDCADLLYDLAGQAVTHFRGYLKSDDEVVRVLRAYQRAIAANIHAQMHEPGHYWEKVEGYHVEIRSGFTELKQGAFSVDANKPLEDFRREPADKRRIQQLVYGGFQRCLYRTQRFQADNERKLAVILDCDAERWLKPIKEQFQIFYRLGTTQSQYVPDFVAETKDGLWMIEAKARNQLTSAEVLAKKAAAEEWCRHASAHAATHPGGKPWNYALVPDDVVDENMALDFLLKAGPAA